MSLPRRALLAAPLALAATPAFAGGRILVAYAGSMGVLMDKGIFPAFTAQTGIEVQGIGQAAMALAHLITGKSLQPDVFVPVSAPPVKIVEDAGLADPAVKIARTSMVLAYSPKSAFAAEFAAPGADWTKILASPGLRFGRTDPKTDPQGKFVLAVLKLAETQYSWPGFAATIAGADENPAQIFTEPSLLARLQAGQIDATLGYKSAVVSQHLPYIELPDAVNLSGKLTYYAMTLKGAANPAGAKSFVDFIASPAGQAILAQYGYKGAAS